MTVTLALGVLVMSPAFGSAAPGQEDPPSAAKPANGAAEILLKMTEPPAPSRQRESVTRDDLRELPKPQVDHLPDNITITVSPADPRCLPGEDPFFEPGRARPRRR